MQGIPIEDDDIIRQMDDRGDAYKEKGEFPQRSMVDDGAEHGGGSEVKQGDAGNMHSDGSDRFA